MCSAAIRMALGPIDKVSTGAVSVLATSGTVRTLYVDASAGGFGVSDTYPRTYVNLETATQVAITDKQAPSSTAWDLAIKRPVLFTNDGDGGPGMGGTKVVSKAFNQVTAADATGTFATGVRRRHLQPADGPGRRAPHHPEQLVRLRSADQRAPRTRAPPT